MRTSKRFDVLLVAGGHSKMVEAGVTRERADELRALLGPWLVEGVTIAVETDSGLGVDDDEE